MLIAIPSRLGYLAVGALVFGESMGLPLPGETALIAATGGAARLSLPLVICVAALAAITGDTMGYWLGRRGGRSILLHRGPGAAHRRRAVERTDAFFARRGTLAVFAARWIPGVRVVAAVLAGAARMPYRRFLVANAAGGILWAATIASLARLAGPSGSLVMAGAGLGFGGLVTVITWWRDRRRSAPPARRPSTDGGGRAHATT